METLVVKDAMMLIEMSKKVLNKNWQGEYTSPSTKLYPHQWSWDSGFVAIGYPYFDEQWACKEMTSLGITQSPKLLGFQVFYVDWCLYQNQNKDF